MALKMPMAVTQDLPVTIKTVEMDRDRALQAQHIARSQMLYGSLNAETIAMTIKRRFDDLYGESWHCVVGKSFGCYVTHQPDNFIYFYIGDFAVLLYKHK